MKCHKRTGHCHHYRIIHGKMSELILSTMKKFLFLQKNKPSTKGFLFQKAINKLKRKKMATRIRSMVAGITRQYVRWNLLLFVLFFLFYPISRWISKKIFVNSMFLFRKLKIDLFLLGFVIILLFEKNCVSVVYFKFYHIRIIH